MAVRFLRSSCVIGAYRAKKDNRLWLLLYSISDCYCIKLTVLSMEGHRLTRISMKLIEPPHQVLCLILIIFYFFPLLRI